MKNININFALIDGSRLPFNYPTGQELIDNIISDIRPPIIRLDIEAKTPDGKVIIISIPNSNSDSAIIEIQETP